MENFRLSWPPTVNTYWRSTIRHGGHGGIAVLLSQKGRQYKTQAELEMLEQNVQKGDKTKRYEVLIDAYPPDRRRRDLDNILKPILDVMEAYGVYGDDSQIDLLIVRRRGTGGYIEVHVSEIAAEDSLVA